LKKITALAFLFAALLFSQASAQDDRAENVLTVWNMPSAADKNQLDVWNSESDTFEKMFPGVKIKGISREYKPQEFVSVMASGKGPDVVHIPITAIPSMAKYGFLAKLNDFTGGWTQKDYMPSIMWESVKVGNDIYGIPYDSYFTTLFYRRDIFDKCGISGPPKTWQDIIADSDIINKKLPETWGIAIPPDIFYFIDFIWQAGGDVTSGGKINLNNPGVIKALKFWNALKFKYNAMPPQDILYDSDIEQLFSAGKIAMMPGVAKRLPVMARRYGLDISQVEIVPLPAGDTGVQAWHAGGEAFIINDTISPEKKKLAFEYIKHRLSPLTQLSRFMRMKELNMIIFPGDFSCATNLINRPEFANVKGLLSYAHAEPTYYKWPMIREDFNRYVLEKIFINRDVDYNQVLFDFMERVKKEYNE
jgi:ABC-type glycerol-3-phosphate transport system substrate-binding protein